MTNDCIMCVTVHYICPACREESGHSATFYCPNPGDCGEPIFFTHLMKAEHFCDWFCATKHCGYNQINQTWDEREIIEALRPAENKSGSEDHHDGICPWPKMRALLGC
jgi:hypothetical protein